MACLVGRVGRRVGVEGWVGREAAARERAACDEDGEGEEGGACGEDDGAAVLGEGGWRGSLILELGL